MSIEELMEDHFRKLKIQVAQELLSPAPVMRTVIALVLIWAPVLLLRDPVFSDARPAWLDSPGFLYALIGISALSVLIASTKSLLPAVLLWIAAIIELAVGAHGQIVYGLLLAAFVSSFAFKFAN